MTSPLGYTLAVPEWLMAMSKNERRVRRLAIKRTNTQREFYEAMYAMRHDDQATFEAIGKAAGMTKKGAQKIIAAMDAEETP